MSTSIGRAERGASYGIEELSGACRVCLEPTRSGSSYCSRECEWTERECWWALAKERGDSPAKRWARAHLGLDERRLGEAA
jgi:hypothetical protein